MHPTIHAKTDPDRAAYIMPATGETITYRDLNERSNQGAHLFRSLGLKTGDVIAIFMENNARYFEITWAAQRSGLYYTCFSSKLTAGEIEYIVRDCGAAVLITSSGAGPVVDQLPELLAGVKLFMTGEARAPYASFEAARAGMPATPIADESAGLDMLYSSGTTGRPKGVKPPFARHTEHAVFDLPPLRHLRTDRDCGDTPSSGTSSSGFLQAQG